MRITARRAAVAGATLFLALGLSACSAGGNADGKASEAPKTQTVAEACDLIETEMNAVGSDVQSAMSNAATDPSEAIAALKTVSDKLKETSVKVQNADVKKVVDPMVDAFGRLGAAMEKITGDPATATEALTEIQAVAGDIQTVGADYGKVCSK